MNKENKNGERITRYDPSGITAIDISNEDLTYIGKKKLEDLGYDFIDKKDNHKLPNISYKSEAIFNLDLLIEMLKFMNNLSSHIKIKLNTDEPMLIELKHELSDGTKQTIIYHIAPYLEQ